MESVRRPLSKHHPLVILLSLVLLASVLPAGLMTASAGTTTVTASGVNMARGEGQLIIYTPDYGTTTQTNEWGFEAAVGADHKVISVGGNNTAIPAGGFVLSGHDTEVNVGMKTWIRENVKVGQYVYYNAVSLVVTVTDEKMSDGDSAFYSVSHAVTGTNVVRGEDMMVVYMPTKGKTTGTNEYGCEVTVKDGLVTFVGGNDSAIPATGFVVSGHNDAGDWLKKQVKIGMSCVYDQAAKTVTFTMDDKSLLAGLENSMNAAKEEMEDAKASYLFMDYSAFGEAFQSIKSDLDKAAAAYKKSKDTNALVDECDRLRDRISDLRHSVSESVTVQYRAAWLRPSQSSASEVDAFVDQLHRSGINTVCVEGIFDSTVIMNVPDDSLFTHNPKFSYDVLQAYVDACRKRDMECHLWMSICHISTISGTNYTKSLARKKPEWLSKNNIGTFQNENNFLMIDPANKEARDYLISFYKYIVKNYDIDGFELDYIRYCDNGTYDFGYTDAAFEGFQKAYNTDVKPKYDTKASYWNDWVQYRCDCISGFVKDIASALKKARPGIVIAADVVPNPTIGKNRNYQDYMVWVKNGWIDLLHPMAYGDGFDAHISSQVREGGTLCAVAVGLGVFESTLGAEDMVEQAIRDNRLSTLGDVYFEASSYLKDQAGEALLKTVYRNEAVTPFRDRDKALKAALAYLLEHAEKVILPNGGMTESEFKTLSDAVGAASESVSGGRVKGELMKELNTVVRKLEDKKAYAALNKDLTRAAMITTVMEKCGWSDLYTDPDPSEVSEPDDESEEVSKEEPSEGPSEPSGTESDLQESSAVTDDSESKPSETSSGLPFYAWIALGAGMLVLAGAVMFLIRKKTAK